jgi:hypothetical protein
LLGGKTITGGALEKTTDYSKGGDDKYYGLTTYQVAEKATAVKTVFKYGVKFGTETTTVKDETGKAYTYEVAKTTWFDTRSKWLGFARSNSCLALVGNHLARH